MRDDCDICGGSGKIRLPVMSKPDLSAYRPSSISLKARMEESSREYSCPECSDVADDNRVMVMGAQEEFPVELAKDPAVMDSIRRGMARPLAAMLVEKGFVRFADGSPTGHPWRGSLRAYVGVVAVGAAKRIDDRISERQFEVADRVIKEAAAQIRHWGSAYSGPEGNISKGHAVEEMLRALETAKAEA